MCYRYTSLPEIKEIHSKLVRILKEELISNFFSSVAKNAMLMQITLEIFVPGTSYWIEIVVKYHVKGNNRSI